MFPRKGVLRRQKKELRRATDHSKDPKAFKRKKGNGKGAAEMLRQRSAEARDVRIEVRAQGAETRRAEPECENLKDPTHRPYQIWS